MSVQQKVIRTVLGQGGRLFPALAGRLAFDLFCRTDDPKKLTQGALNAIQRAAPVMGIAQRFRLKTSSGFIVTYEFSAKSGVPYRGRALVVHGWRSRTDFMAKMIGSMTSDGWDVIGLDLPGHGQSSGRKLNVKLGVEAISAASKRFGSFDLAVGHSFGGVVVVNASTGSIKGFDPVTFGRIVVIASPNSMPEMFTGVGRYFGLRPKAQAAMEHRVERIAGYPLSSYVMSEQLARSTVEVLIAHAPDDREVAFASGLAMAEAGRHVTLLPFEGLGHRRIIADEKVFQAISQFASKELPSALT